MKQEKLIRISRIISVVILILTFLCLFAYSVRHVTLRGQKLGMFTKPIKAFASFPNTVVNVLKSGELQGIPPTYIDQDDSFEQINRLTTDLYGLNAFYSKKDNIWEIKLFNLKNDSVIYTWYLNDKNFVKRYKEFKNSEPRNCILLPNKSLIVALDGSQSLYRLDKNSNIVWHNTDKTFHHAYNLAPDGNIWICTYGRRYFQLAYHKNDESYYTDDFITKIDVETGELLYDKSVSDILIENGYENFVYGCANNQNIYSRQEDPLHLNDIEPVNEDGPYWKKGDLFLSLRHRSLVIHYRPETNKILHLHFGPFLNQHDVDIISDHEISIFDNNTTELGRHLPRKSNDDSAGIKSNIKDRLMYSGIIIYNYEDSTYRNHLENKFVEEEIFTHTEGFHQFLSSGDVYVESQNSGKIYLLNEDKVLLKKQFSTSIENKVHLPLWIRIYENLNH